MVSQSVIRASLAFFLKARYASNMSCGGGISDPWGGGACRIDGNRERSPIKGTMRGAIVSMGRCFLIGGVGVGVRHSRGRYKD